MKWLIKVWNIIKKYITLGIPYILKAIKFYKENIEKDALDIHKKDKKNKKK